MKSQKDGEAKAEWQLIIHSIRMRCQPQGLNYVETIIKTGWKKSICIEPNRSEALRMMTREMLVGIFSIVNDNMKCQIFKKQTKF